MRREELRRAEFAEFVIRECIYAPGLRLARHSHDYSNVTVVTGGRMFEASEGGEHDGHPCSVVLKPAGTEHENRVGGTGARTLTIEMRPGSGLETDIAGRKCSWVELPRMVRASVALWQATRTATNIEGRALELLRLVLATEECHVPMPGWIADVKDILQRRFGEGRIRFGIIAKEVGVHPVYLARAFRRYVGTSMTDYVRALRLLHARKLLAGSQRSAAAIAGDSGFSDASHFSHVFSKLLDVSPRAYRELFRQV